MTPTQAFNAFKENLPPGCRCQTQCLEDTVFISIRWKGVKAWQQFHATYEVDAAETHPQPEKFFSELLEKVKKQYALSHETHTPDAS